VLFPHRFFAELKQAPLNKGARWVVRRRLSSQLLVPVVDAGVVTNVNLPEQVDRLRRAGHGVGYPTV
jgi:CTP:molybdopterin cytidylyltransferase MocA